MISEGCHRDYLQALKEIHRCLSPSDGVFLMVDPFRRKGETVEEYRQRSHQVV